MLTIDSPFRNPYLNLAAEEYLLKQRKEDFFFLYIDEPSVIVGKHQNTLAEVHYAYAREKNILIARRLSGGGTVYHDEGNLNFCFIANGKEGFHVDFRKWTQPILNALHILGIPAEYGGKNDLILHGKKISGNAGHVFHNRSLHHGTLLFNARLHDLNQVLHPQGVYCYKGVLSRRSEVSNIGGFLKEPIDMPQFRAFMMNQVSEQLHASLSTFTESEMESIHALAQKKYRTWEWIYAYSPDYSAEKEIVTRHGRVSIFLEVSKGLIKNIRLLSSAYTHSLLIRLEQILQGSLLEEDFLRRIISNELHQSEEKMLFEELLPVLF